jgi:pilus assembly protein Flp/PilA
MLARLGRSLIQFLKHSEGPTAVEYAVMLALIIVVCVSSIYTLGRHVDRTCDVVRDSMAGS